MRPPVFRGISRAEPLVILRTLAYCHLDLANLVTTQHSKRNLPADAIPKEQIEEILR